jgi:hypothetical protein
MGTISSHELARVVDYLEEISDPRRTRNTGISGTNC